MQLTTELTEKHNDGKRETISFYNFLCALVRLNLIIHKKITREHRELLEIKSLFTVKNSSVNSVVFFTCIFGFMKIQGKIMCINRLLCYY